jgi:LysM repeat protein
MRLLAPIALIAAAVVVVVVVVGSLDGSEDDGDRERPAREQTATDDSPEEGEEEEKFYVVQPGDSFSTIAEEQGVSEERLQQLNPDLDPQALAPGQRVKLR